MDSNADHGTNNGNSYENKTIETGEKLFGSEKQKACFGTPGRPVPAYGDRNHVQSTSGFHLSAVGIGLFFRIGTVPFS